MVFLAFIAVGVLLLHCHKIKNEYIEVNVILPPPQ